MIRGGIFDFCQRVDEKVKKIMSAVCPLMFAFVWAIGRRVDRMSMGLDHSGVVEGVLKNVFKFLGNPLGT